jgi:flagellar motility protein MotE (MotC chaperone)
MKVILFLFISIIINTGLCALDAYEDATIEEKRKELSVLKAEFEEYYRTQEEKLTKKLNQIELKEMLITKKENNIKKIRKENKKLLSEIKMEIFNKTIKIYNNMKAKNVAKVFTQMISEHNIQKVYDIIIKLKSQQAVKILAKMNQKNTSLLTQLMLDGKKPNINNKEK